MKITISNFGPIGHIEMDLSKKLIITYGKNNIGKSYAMTMVYLFLKNLIDKRSTKYKFFMDLEYSRNSKLTKIYNELEKTYQQTDNFKIDKNINEAVTIILNQSIMPDFEKSMLNSFGDIRNKQTKKQTKILLEINANTIEVVINGRVQVGKVELSFSESDHNIKMKDITYSKFTQIVIDRIFELLEEINKQVGVLFFFPASRSGIYSGMSAYSSIIAEFSKNRALISQKIELPSLSEPISDYIIKLSNISNNRYKDEKVSEVINSIEKDILNGIIGFDKTNNAITYQPSNGKMTLRLNNTSSMVSEIAPIVAFLKYILHKNLAPKTTKEMTTFVFGTESNSEYTTVFIEEPEAHLHPEAQIRLIEALVKLSGCKVNLIMTSHSNYIFNKLNNMILGEKLNYNDYLPIILEDTEKGSIGKNLEIDELGVTDENFIDISEQLFAEREEYLEKFNSKVDNDNGN